ncbi:MAG TPA: YkvA family protein [Xanthobacteraceae bacterium]|nr:YkvA family protein [Xanthobacteraceae bacterium]
MAFSTTENIRAAADEARVRAGFWTKIRAVAAHIPFAEDALAAYYCAFDRETPLHVRATLWAALAYFIMPFDVIPDYLPLIGFTDDAAVLATALRLVAAHMQPEHREAARRALKKLVAD